MMGYNSDDDDDVEEGGRGCRFLGFMFGNVDNAGDLDVDVDYLDEDAKEHLAAAAGMLGTRSLTDIMQTSTVAVEQDYDESDEESDIDIDEDLETTEENHLLPKTGHLSGEVLLGKMREARDEMEEDYDEEEEEEEEEEEDIQEVVSDICSTPLPVLFIEDGSVVLRFSEILGMCVPNLMKKKKNKAEKRDHHGYTVAKDRYEAMDVSDIAEEDEETFLKESGKLFQSLKQWTGGLKHDVSELDNDNFNFVTPVKSMKEDIILDQQDWEEGIYWGPGEEGSVSSEIDEMNQGHMPHSFSSLLEPFGSRNPSSESRYHPQLLRLESLADGRVENDAVRQYCKLAPQNRNMLEGSWLENIIWDSDIPVRKPNLILDLEDEQMLFEILDNKDCEHIKLHSGAMIATTRNGDPLELPKQGSQFDWGHVANDKHYANRKPSQQPKKHTAQGKKICHSQQVQSLHDESDLDSFAGDLENLLVDVDETKRKKKKKTGVVGDEAGLAPGSRPSFGFICGKGSGSENVERVKERKTICGACGQVGHMRTNKHCPKYLGTPDQEKPSGNSNHPNSSTQSLQKTTSKKLPISKVEDLSPIRKVLKLKIKFGSTERFPDTQVTGDAESVKPAVKVKKIIFKRPREEEVIGLHDQVSQDGSNHDEHRRTKRRIC